ncbi:MAG TPA: ATP-grasp domain-containing protein [Pyrinomonadaceae bacterium]|nr:ATP-grasp domain-containing protein [Pyrinomonadaceae bacterium]
MPENRPLNVICLATYFKGGDFIRECKRLGNRVVLITKEKMLEEDWPRDSLDDLIAVPNDAGVALMIDLASFIARQLKPDRVVALEEFDVMTAALIREHLCLPGMSSSTAKTFRDKYRMAETAKAAGVVLPEFVPLINTDEISAFMERVPPPWIIKPRSDVSAIGIRKVDEAPEVWRIVGEMNERENLRERASYYLLAQFVAGEVFHVDSIVNNGRVVFAGANRYGRPPLEVAHGGGAYISRTVAHGSENEKKLFAINRTLVKALKLERGAAHAEFIKSDADGRFYFLEIAARVGGAYIADVLEAASGLNLWREWARMEATDGSSQEAGSRKQEQEAGDGDDGGRLMEPARAGGVGQAGSAPKQKPDRKGAAGLAKLKPARNEYAGIVLSLSKQEQPDTAAYDDPEIVYRVKKRHHAGLIVRSKNLERVEELLNEYAARFADDFVAVVPPLEKAE